MVKFCLKCKKSFWGGKYCPKCEGQLELLDAALPENQKYLSELDVDVRPKYFARSAMMLTLFGLVMAFPVGAFIFLRGIAGNGNLILWAAIGIAVVVGIAWGTWILSSWFFGKQMEDVPDKKDMQTD